MRKGTWVRGDLGGKRDSSVKVGRALFAAFQRSPIIDEIRQPDYPASLLPAAEHRRCTRLTVKLNLQILLLVADAADTDVNLMNTFPAGMDQYHAQRRAPHPARGYSKQLGGALWAQ